MKIFISWSGEPSRSIARALGKWLKMVIQQADPWMSDEEINSGARWNEAIARSLKDTQYGILCVTRDNQTAPWLLFEAGALAKGLDDSHVVPVCVDMQPSELAPGPLTSFQARTLIESDMRRLLHDVNRLIDQPLANEQIDETFDAFWPKLSASIHVAIQEAGTASARPTRTTEDMLAELVDSIREIRRISLDQDDVYRLENAAVILAKAFNNIPELDEAATRLSRAASDFVSAKYM